MAGYNPAGTIPDYIIDPETKKTFDEWTEIFYPCGKNKPRFWSLGKLYLRLKYGVKC